MYYYIEPEVAGGIGDSSILDTSSHPPKIMLLEYRFEGWLGDDLLESFPCFIITKRLADAISVPPLSGFALMPVEISKSENFIESHPHVKLPEFQWLKISGSAGSDDFGLTENHNLVISKSALEVLKRFNIKQADLCSYPQRHPIEK
ncbi:hypothetical protein V2K05_05385 [Pseudomonas alliivorans]|nr:hypothetical protein [Pseudomonas alliivorans]MEE4970623.1 hypothetical protein [Pseudomonas alliivorans]MEE4975618.1 hypothetical protein [Pseudomonas alliivorans]MEE4980717.1 hypothetical protein [Pseudomonas alliivorans]MEE5001270.1 hypothetical protein [Pseudomonas alliivorans]